MNRNIHRQIHEERGVDIRNPSTACLLIDSNDSLQGDITATNFTISSNQNLILGSFTRLAVQEVAVDWCIPNISRFYDQDGVSQFDTRVVTVKMTSGTYYTATLTAGFYNVAQCLAEMVLALNAAAGSSIFSLVQNDAIGVILRGTSAFQFPLRSSTGGTLNQLLPDLLGFNVTAATNYQTDHYPGESSYRPYPQIMPFSYVDIVSNELTYCQDVKDATTNPIKRDVLHRFYFANDSMVPRSDKYGFPIQLGYEQFNIRRSIPFPKQIKWDPLQQMGNLSFQAYVSTPYNANGQNTIPIPFAGFDTGLNEGNFSFQMTLLVSEV